MKLGCIGIDSSHLPEFCRRINELYDSGRTPCRVTHFFDPGTHEWQHPEGNARSEADVQQWKQKTLDLGAKQVSKEAELLDGVNGVLVLNINGHRHKQLAAAAIARGMPVYVDKPMTCSVVEARDLLAEVRSSGARCYSASSLRFAPEIQKLNFEKLGTVVAIDAFGNGELLDMMPDLWHYGCHSIEMVDAIFKASGQGAGVKRVSAVAMPDRHLLDMDYHDGRYVRIRMDRRASWAFGATVHGERSVQQFTVDFAPVYTRLVEGMVKFFEGGEPPVELRDIVENIAVMEAGNASIKKDGDWVDVEPVEKPAGSES